ncbi:hypothetical protein SUGI_0326040 [Cryptomeria japonica]|nr:hypothetical protein SUGI_0326040 [Cryptomeria japonica]
MALPRRNVALLRRNAAKTLRKTWHSHGAAQSMVAHVNAVGSTNRFDILSHPPPCASGANRIPVARRHDMDHNFGLNVARAPEFPPSNKAIHSPVNITSSGFASAARAVGRAWGQVSPVPTSNLFFGGSSFQAGWQSSLRRSRNFVPSGPRGLVDNKSLWILPITNSTPRFAIGANCVKLSSGPRVSSSKPPQCPPPDPSLPPRPHGIKTHNSSSLPQGRTNTMNLPSAHQVQNKPLAKLQIIIRSLLAIIAQTTNGANADTKASLANGVVMELLLKVSFNG